MPGLSFDNFRRNQALEASGTAAPKLTSTGTTIVGCKFKGGVILASDTRATAGSIVADKNCLKLHRIAPKIWCAGAGTAADNDKVTELESSNLEVHSLWMDRAPRVVSALTHLKQHLFKYQGHIGAHMILAGVDPVGTHLHSIAAHGSTEAGPYLALGSGSLAATAVLETQWKEEMTKEDAMEICANAIEAGIFNDLGSGSNVDLCILEEKQPAKLIRGYRKPNERLTKQKTYEFKRGTTSYFKNATKVFYLRDQPAASEEAMEVDPVS